MQRVFWSLSIMFVLSLCGCGFDVKPVPVVVPPPPSLEDLPLVAHPEYDNWNKFDVGTTVIRKDNLASAEGKVFLHTTLRLASKSETGITVESKTAIERDGVREESDVTSSEYPAQFRLPKGMELAQFQLPTMKAERVAEESLTVGDQSA